MNTTLVNYKYPENSPVSNEFKLKINGEEVFVYTTSVAYFAAVSFEGVLDVEIETTRNINNVVVRPLKHKISPIIDKDKIRFSIAEPMNLFIEVNNQVMPLFLFANPLETDVPSVSDPKVLYFEEGKRYNVGTLTLEDDQVVYIEGGAVVQGVIRATKKQNIKICGRGVFDGSLEPRSEEERRFFVVLEGCKDVYMEGIILIEPPLWMLVLGACSDVYIKNVKEIGDVVSSDGVDIVGSKNVVIDGMFIRNNDDCIAVKSLDVSYSQKDAFISWAEDVDNILVKNCVFYTSEKNGGNALEIGFELRTDYVQNIVFENNDVIAVHGFGGIFTIHNGDRAIVRNVRYENIRIEHFFDKLVDLRIVHSPMWNIDNKKGQIRNIYFKDIYANEQVFNAGYTNSLIGGFTPENTVEGVVFENFYVGNKKAETIDDIWLHSKHVSDIQFK